jgi:hypothetical protein
LPIELTSARRPSPDAYAIDRDVLVAQRLDHKIGDHAPVGRMHAWSIGIEDAGNLIGLEQTSEKVCVAAVPSERKNGFCYGSSASIGQSSR